MRKFAPLRRCLAATLLLAATLSCTNERPPPSDVPFELHRLYARIHECRDDYEKGLELVLTGDALHGKNLLEATTTRMRVVGDECRRTPGCDIRLFTRAMGEVFEQNAALERLTPDLEAEMTALVEEADLEASPVVPHVPQVSRMIRLLEGADLGEVVPFNGKVDAALNDWLTWNRPSFIESYENYQYLRAKVAPIYEKAGLPEALLFAMMAKESGAKVHSYSRAGAAGPLQFMRHTARRYGLGSVNGFDMRLDPVLATEANVAYLNDQMRVFNDNLEKALAAYNVGETKLRRLHRKHKGAEFWDPQIYYALPSETRNYVPQVFAAAWLFLHADDYGLELPILEAHSTSIVLESEMSIGELTICLGQEHNASGWFRTLRNLNPHLKPPKRSKAGSRIEIPSILARTYAERCVGGSELMARARRLHDASYNAKPEILHYTVRRGDTLAAIAATHRCSLTKLAAMNRIEAPGYVIHVGQRLSVPSRI